MPKFRTVLPNPRIFRLRLDFFTIEKNIIEQALIRTGGNVSKTAQLLRLQRTTLIQKMNKLKRDGDGAFQPENPLL